MKNSTKIKLLAKKIREAAETMRVTAHMARFSGSGDLPHNESMHEVEMIAEAIGQLAAVVRLRQNWGEKDERSKATQDQG